VQQHSSASRVSLAIDLWHPGRETNPRAARTVDGFLCGVKCASGYGCGGQTASDLYALSMPCLYPSCPCPCPCLPLLPMPILSDVELNCAFGKRFKSQSHKSPPPSSRFTSRRHCSSRPPPETSIPQPSPIRHALQMGNDSLATHLSMILPHASMHCG
jgi:hypothetical protein